MHEKPSYVEKLEIESKEIPNGQESPNIVQLYRRRSKSKLIKLGIKIHRNPRNFQIIYPKIVALWHQKANWSKICIWVCFSLYRERVSGTVQTKNDLNEISIRRGESDRSVLFHPNIVFFTFEMVWFVQKREKTKSIQMIFFWSLP